MTRQSDYWFAAKRYGWGWGWPLRWQGWLVFGVFGVLLGAGAVALRPSGGAGWFSMYVVALCSALVLVCYLKGEPPRWRWGKR